MTHLLACISVGFIFRFWKRKKHSPSFYTPSATLETSNKKVSLSNLGEVLATSIMNSINTVILIGGFVVLFSVVISILTQSKFFDFLNILFSPFFKDSSYITGTLTGMLELTNGVKQIASIPNKMISINIIICSFLLGFGGISVLLQVLSISSKAKISIKPYFFGKLLQGFLAAIYTALILKNFRFFNLDIVPTFISHTSKVNSFDSSYIVLILLIILSLLLLRKLWKSQEQKGHD